MIEAALANQPAAGVCLTILLWEQLAPELILIIGEGGFKPLYNRSIRLAGVQYPLLVRKNAAGSGSQIFAGLQASLHRQDPMQVMLASAALFDIFLNLLASLIGEELTTHLLHSAWSNKISEIPAKDLSK